MVLSEIMVVTSLLGNILQLAGSEQPSIKKNKNQTNNTKHVFSLLHTTIILLFYREVKLLSSPGAHKPFVSDHI